jgi:hypothetical protein
MGILEKVGTPNYSLKMTQSRCPDKESPFQIFREMSQNTTGLKNSDFSLPNDQGQNF